MRPRYLLGHSLGEFSALVASGLLQHRRRRATHRRTRGGHGPRRGRDRGIDGRADGRRRRRARRPRRTRPTSGSPTSTAPGQIVVSGTRAGLDDLLARHKELGWRRATPLPVGGAFHSPLMAPAQDELDKALASVEWGATDAVLISNVDAQVHVSADDWRELLSRQLTSPVRVRRRDAGAARDASPRRSRCPRAASSPD